MAQRIDFKHVRENADFSQILNALGIDTTKDGTTPDQYKAVCPFHDDTNPSLKLNFEKGLFHCFACGAKGNVLDFVMQKEGLDIRPAAQWIIDTCGVTPHPGAKRSTRWPKGSPGSVRPAARAIMSAVDSIGTSASAVADAEIPTENRELTFELQLDRDEELVAWLEERGIDRAAIERFGLGRASAKSKTIGGRLAIPIHNAAGSLVAYCGRFVGNDVPKDVPKYVFPKGFHKELEVFNLHRVSPESPSKAVVIVESFLSVIKHYPTMPIVSVMGRSISHQQVELIRKKGFRRAIIVGDGDHPGRDGARQVAGELATAAWTRVVDLNAGVKPHHLAPEALHELITRALRRP